MVQEIEIKIEMKYTIAGKDTGIYRRVAFLQEVDKQLRGLKTPQDYCMLAINIEYFRLFNEWFGVGAGDRFLQGIAEILLLSHDRSALLGGRGSIG